VLRKLATIRAEGQTASCSDSPLHDVRAATAVLIRPTLYKFPSSLSHNANQSAENKTKLVVEEKAVRDLERKIANFTDALGEAESKEVRQSISNKLEDIGMQLATARTNTAMLSREMKSAVDPKSAAAHVHKIFVGFSKLPKAEQRTLLEKYVAKIIYHESQFSSVAKTGRCDYSSLEVKMRLPENSPTLRVTLTRPSGVALRLAGFGWGCLGFQTGN